MIGPENPSLSIKLNPYLSILQDVIVKYMHNHKIFIELELVNI